MNFFNYRYVHLVKKIKNKSITRSDDYVTKKLILKKGDN